MGEKSKLGWLIGLFEQAIWAASLYFLYLLWLSISKILALSQPLTRANFYFKITTGVLGICGDFACIYGSLPVPVCSYTLIPTDADEFFVEATFINNLLLHL
jgi:hypothetical protein